MGSQLEWGNWPPPPTPTAFTAFATWPRWQQLSVTTTLVPGGERGSGLRYQSLTAPVTKNVPARQSCDGTSVSCHLCGCRNLWASGARSHPLRHASIHAGTSVAVPKAAERPGAVGTPSESLRTLSWCQPLLLLSDLPVAFKGQTATLWHK